MPHLGVNAVENTARIIVSFEKLKAELASKKSRAPFPEEVQGITLNVGGVIQGGTKINVVPDRCSCTIDMRWFKDLTPVILYGPGSITQAHVANECVDVESLTTSSKVYALTIMRYLEYREE